MLTMQDLLGVFVPIVTPYLDDGGLDFVSFANLTKQIAESGVQGIVVNGTTGESPTIREEEWASLYKTARSLPSVRQLPIVVGTGTNATSATVRMTERAALLGADAALVVVPYYSRPSFEGILAHFQEVARVGLPVILYHVPHRTGVSLTADETRRILELENVIGMKDASGGTQLLASLMEHEAKPVLAGEDASMYDMLAAGASGAIMASANVHTKVFVDVFAKFRSGDRSGAREIFDALLPLIRLLFLEPNPAPLKWLLYRQGIIRRASLRLPLVPATAGLQRELERCLVLS